MDEERLIVDLIDTPEFQRLHHIRQLGLSFLTYPGATHTRFSHSIGVAHLMKRFLARLMDDRRSQPYAPRLSEDRMIAIAAALLHDVGHGPFSHAIEKVTDIHHEVWSRAVVTGETAITRRLEAYAKGMAQEVADVIGRTHENRAIVKLLSGQLDVDRTDYLLRDALMTGARYGALDLEWLIHALRLGTAPSRTGKDGAAAGEEVEVGLDLEKGLSIAEDFMMARFYMYQHVYLHKTTRAAELLVQHLLFRAVELAEAGELTLPPPLQAVLAARGRPEAALGAFLSLTDATLWAAFFEWRHHPDRVLGDFARRLLSRNLYKAVTCPDECPKERVYEVRHHFARKLKLPESYAMLLDNEQTTTYKDPYLLPAGGGRAAEAVRDADAEATISVYLFDREGRAKELSEASTLIAYLRGRAHPFRRIYVPAEIRDEVRQALRGT
ncbi:MAG: HD domain-containing protein [Hydrogenibacillus sp.]|nr:HD domain-containing protein [Hydrogenibacillus sp.]